MGGGTFVDFDRGLNKAVNHLREALGDSAEHPAFIETLPRKGYRFVAQVACEEPKPVAPGTATQPSVSLRTLWRRPLWVISGAVALLLAAGLATNIGGVRSRILDRLHPNTTRISSLAVIPLESLSGDQEQEYFAEGLTDQLITNLAQMGSTRVTSRASILRYKGTKKTIQEIGHELNVMRL